MGLRHQLAQKSALDRQAYLPPLPRMPVRTSNLAPAGRTFAGKRSALGVSVVGHVAVLGLGLVFAGANPFDTIPAEAIAVDIVSPDDISGPDSSVPLPQKIETPPSGDLLFADSAPSAPLIAAPAPTPVPVPPPAARGRPAAQQATRQAAAKPQPAEPARPPAISPLSYPPIETPAPPPDPQQLNFARVFGLPIALPDGQLGGGFDSPAFDAAKVAPDEAAAFRNHLKTCGTLPGAISLDDKVRIVLRVAFAPNGTLAGDPTLIEASATAKGPLLLKSAITALRRCQPYTMLPADRYEEWKVLDLSFTPRDLAGG
jgi:hypothetical protein